MVVSLPLLLSYKTFYFQHSSCLKRNCQREDDEIQDKNSHGRNIQKFHMVALRDKSEKGKLIKSYDSLDS